MKQPNYKKIPLDGVKCKLTEQIKVTIKPDVLTESVKNVISVSCFSDVYSIKVSQKRAEYKGKAIFFVAYETENGEILKCESTADFDGVLESECITEKSQVIGTATAYKTEADTSGIKLTAIAHVSVEATVIDVKEYECLENGEDVVCDITENTFLISHGRKETTYPLSEEFTLSYKVKEVLSQNAICVITNAQCGVGSIIVDGEVYLSAILLQSSEKKDIIKESKVVPFRIEIDCDDAMPSDMAVCSARVRAFKTDVSVDDEKSTVNAVITLKLCAEAFTESVFSLSHDVFSKTEELDVKKDVFTARARLEDRCIRKDVNIAVSSEEDFDGCEVLGTFFERIELISKEKSGDNLLVTGALSCSAILRKTDGTLRTLALDFPVDLSIELGTQDFDEYELFAVCEKSSIRIVDANHLEISAGLIFTLSPYKIKDVNYVKEVVVVGEKQLEEDAISVIIPLAGEDLWSLSKRLNQSPEEIISANPDISFPLSGEERIVVYRQK